jgi:hypothetical protein
MERAESGFVYLRQRLTTRGSKETDLMGDPEVSHHHHVAANIPSGRLTRLTSIFRRVGRTEMQGTEDAKSGIRVTQWLELQSIDYDYHAQIRSGSPSESKKSLIADKGQIRDAGPK